MRLTCLLTVSLGLVWLTAGWATAGEGLPEKGAHGRYRICFLGDSITEGHTLPLLFQQALKEAQKPVPLCFNAGIGGDNAAGMRQRLDRDVRRWKPDLVVLSTGINDLGLGRTLAQYEEDMTAIAERLVKKEKLRMIILTSSVITVAEPAVNQELQKYNQTAKAVAKKFGIPVGDVFPIMDAAWKQGVHPTEKDNCHLNFDGYRSVTRGLLNAVGYPDVAVPEKAVPIVLPGIIHRWQMRPAAKDEKQLDEAAVAALKPDDTWKTLTLPQTESAGHWWQDQERERGVAVQLEKLLGPAPFYIGVAVVDSPKPAKVFLNTGTGLTQAYLNGKQVYKHERHGWAPGRERIPVELQAGKNTIVIQSGNAFFLSLTGGADW